MATRSTIALEYADGTVDQVYCHWDGYLSNNGEILLKHYQDPYKVQKMMGLGDISSLGEDIGEQHSFDDAANCPDTTFYGRDRGETGTEAKRFKDFADYKANHQYEEFEYILRTDGNWYVCQYGKGYELLADALAKEAIEALVAEDE
jgi:hypothetical protein